MASFFHGAGLGPEPFDLDRDYWRGRLAATNRCLKAVLLDPARGGGRRQHLRRRIAVRGPAAPRPGSRRKVSAAEAERLRKAIVTVLNRAIERRGSSIRDYVGGSGLKGQYQEEFRAYGRTGAPCVRSGRPIVCLRLAGRSTHFCPGVNHV